jgi:ribonuclease Z
MNITFLGTSSGVPTKTRNVSASVVKMESSKAWCLVDCGEGTQHQLLKVPFSLNNLKMICITHMHGDHCFGLPGLLATASMSNRTKPLIIVGPAELQTWLESTIELTQSRLTYPLEFVNVATQSDRLETYGFFIERVALSHRVPSFAYVFTEKNMKPMLDVAKLKAADIEPGPLWGAIQREENSILVNGDPIKAEYFLLAARKPRRIIVAGDNDSPELLADYAKEVDMLVHEATYTEEIALKVGKAPQHSCAKSVAQFASACQLNNLVLTHFSSRYQDETFAGKGSIAEIEREAKRFYTGNVFLANDFDTYHLDMDGVLTKQESSVSGK